MENDGISGSNYSWNYAAVEQTNRRFEALIRDSEYLKSAPVLLF